MPKQSSLTIAQRLIFGFGVFFILLVASVFIGSLRLDTLNEMTVSINHVSERANETHAITTQSGDLSREGDKAIQATASELQDAAQTVDTAAETLREMGEKSKRISHTMQKAVQPVSAGVDQAQQASSGMAQISQAAQDALSMVDETRRTVSRFRI